MPTLARQSPEKLTSVKAEIEHIVSLNPGEVRTLWRKKFRKDVPRALTTQLLVRMLAWNIQEKAFGDHDPGTRRLLDSYGRQDAEKVVLFRRLKPGTSVVREYQGVRHIVTIGGDGFVWRGKTYDSL
jgi:Protein of unknown function (DUF2924)